MTNSVDNLITLAHFCLNTMFLISIGNHNGLSLGVIKSVHGLDVTQHVQANAGNEEQQQGGQQASPDWHGKESHTVPSWTKGAVVDDIVIKEGLHLKDKGNKTQLYLPATHSCNASSQ